MTSSIFSPRRLFALCSPMTQVRASATLLLPQPLGPTIAVTPWSNDSSGAIGEGFEAGDFETFETHVRRACSAASQRRLETGAQSSKPSPLWQGGTRRTIFWG